MPVLEDWKEYIDGDGQRHRIGGTVRTDLAWCWSLSGFWYVRATGQHLTYGTLPDNGEWGHYINPRERAWIVSEAPDEG